MFPFMTWLPVKVCPASVLARVALASGRVKVLSAVVGPVNLVNPFPVPPYVEAMIEPFQVPVVITPVFGVMTNPL